MAEWKKVIVSGSNAELNNIFASGAITGSHISSSGDLFASLSVVPHDWVVTYNSESGQFYYTSSDAVGTDTIGEPSDGTYDGGVFPFTPDTTIADAVDDLNTLISSLVPAQAPNLNNISSSNVVDGTSGEDDGEVTTAQLSFGATNSSFVGDYTIVSGLNGLTPAGTNTSVNTDAAFIRNTTPDYRLGVFNGIINIVGRLNGTTPQNPTDTGTNYKAYAFNNGHLGELRIYVNDNTTPKHTLNLTSSMAAIASSVNGNGTGFTNITATRSAAFPNGDPFTNFIHRTGSFVVDDIDQRNGWNWCRVVHTGSNFDVTTNYIEWVNDKSGSIAATFPSTTLKQRTPTGTRYLSQIPYYTGVTVEFTASISNAYTMTYVANNAIGFTDENTNLNDFVSQNIPALGNNDPRTTTLTVSSSGAYSNNTNASYFFTSSENGGVATNGVGDGAGTDFGNGIGVRANFAKPFLTTANSSYSRTGSMFLIGKASTNNTTGSSADYKFLNETGRLIADNYDTQASVTASANAWDSQNSNIDTNKGLIVYGQPRITNTGGISSTTFYNYNRIISPFSDNYSYNGGNFSNISAPATPPNFSGLMHTEYSIFLKYANGTSATPTKNVTLYGVNTTVVPDGTSLSGNNIHCYFKVPGQTGWRDMATAAPDGAYTALVDGVGCYNGTVPSLILGSTNTSLSLPVQLVSEVVPASGYAVLWIEAHKDWEGYIYNITIS
jgi:hypothetical protein